MARRKYKKRKQQPLHDPSLSQGVIAIVLLVFAIIIALSFFGKAGTLGLILNEWILSFLFGSIRFFVPPALIVFAWYLVADVDYNYRPTHGIGAILFFITTSSLIHLRFPINEMWLQALEGNGGGVFGMFAWVLKTYLGNVASWVLLVGTTFISVLLIFNTSLARFVTLHKELMERMGFFGKGLKNTVDTLFVEEEEYEDEEEESEDEEEYEEEDEDDRFTKKRVGKRQKEEEEDEYEEDEDEYEEEEDEDMGLPTNKPKTHKIPVDLIPAWQKNAIIKKLPSLNLLSERKTKPSSGDIEENEKIIEETLNEFKIRVKMETVLVGPTVTQFAFRPAKGVKLSKITTLSNDLALALAAHPIRIEAPIPGKALVGIEVPNEKTAMVSLKELLTSKEYKKKKHKMMIGLGKDVGGKAWFADLPRMPHLLIAGATGSGKTVCMNTIITSLLYQNTAADLRFIMVDPKRVELTMYNGIPHLLTPVITNTQKTVNALKWTIGEMDRRFEVLAKAGNRDITTYNKQHPKTKIPQLVFIIDELADLMATSSNEVEAGIIRLAQMARAVGIHLILATQRPSVNVITGLMKANIPARIAFSVASITDSRTILDSKGAEKLIGKGDMLFQTADLSKPVRLQGAFISEEETKNIVKYLKGDADPMYVDSIVEKQKNGSNMSLFGSAGDDQDALFEDAQQAIIGAGKASASFLQRKLKVGYARAARILDELEEAGIIGPSNGAKPREILVTETELHTMDMGGELNVYEDSTPSTDEVPTEVEEEVDDEELEEEDNSEYDEEEEIDEDQSEDEEDSEYEEEEEDDEDVEYEQKEEELEEEEDIFQIKNISP
jgi:DNA segregation ATPase FtsK/SpoIIIE, S-DNA-T family